MKGVALFAAGFMLGVVGVGLRKVHQQRRPKQWTMVPGFGRIVADRATVIAEWKRTVVPRSQ